MIPMDPFKMSDLGSFVPNEWSDPDRVLDMLVDPAYVTVTMRHPDGMTAAILAFTCYSADAWHGFFLISKRFTATQGKVIRAYIRSTMRTLDADRLQTDSQDSPEINKWHQFLGFTKEGTRRRMLNGKDYNMWALMREDI